MSDCSSDATALGTAPAATEEVQSKVEVIGGGVLSPVLIRSQTVQTDELSRDIPFSDKLSQVVTR